MSMPWASKTLIIGMVYMVVENTSNKQAILSDFIRFSIVLTSVSK